MEVFIDELDLHTQLNQALYDFEIQFELKPKEIRINPNLLSHFDTDLTWSIDDSPKNYELNYKGISLIPDKEIEKFKLM